MEEKQLTPEQAFEVVYKVTGTALLNRVDNQVLEASLRVLFGLIPKAEVEKDVIESETKTVKG